MRAGALALLLLSGCASTDIVYRNGDKEVSFRSDKDYSFIHGHMDADGMEIMATGVDASTSNAITADVLKGFGSAVVKGAEAYMGGPGAKRGFAP